MAPQPQLCLTSVLRSVPAVGFEFLVRYHLSKALGQKQETQWLPEGTEQRKLAGELYCLADLTRRFLSVSLLVVPLSLRELWCQKPRILRTVRPQPRCAQCAVCTQSCRACICNLEARHLGCGSVGSVCPSSRGTTSPLHVQGKSGTLSPLPYMLLTNSLSLSLDPSEVL